MALQQLVPERLTQRLLSPREVEPRYARVRVRLTGRQPKVLDLGFPADYVVFKFPGVDATRVYVAFNQPHAWLPLADANVVRSRVPVIKRILFTWEPSEEGKTIEVYFAGAPSIETAVRLFTIAGDYVGLARESTLQSTLSTLQSIESKIATEATLSSVLSTLQSIDSKVATEATLGNILSTLQSIDSKVATESTLSLVARRLSAELLAETTFSYDNSGGTTAVEAAVFSTPPAAPDAGVATIQFYVDTSTTVKVGITRGGTERKAYLNGGSSVNANAWYEFAMTLAPNDTIQIYVDVPSGAVVNGYFAILFRRR